MNLTKPQYHISYKDFLIDSLNLNFIDQKDFILTISNEYSYNFVETILESWDDELKQDLNDIFDVDIPLENSDNENSFSKFYCLQDYIKIIEFVLNHRYINKNDIINKFLDEYTENQFKVLTEKYYLDVFNYFQN